MKRLERRLLKITDEVQRLRREEELVAGELEMHRHLADDAERDAAVTGEPVERLNVRDTRKDVARFGRALETIRRKRQRLEARRVRLLSRLDRE